MSGAGVWLYRDHDGEVLAEVRRDDTPPLGYRVRIGGDGGPVRCYVVQSVDAAKHELTLEKDK